MKVKHIPCGPFANESERNAIELLKSKLEGTPGDGYWVLLSNLAHSATATGMSDEIDLVVLGPSGIQVIEIKHWDIKFFQEKLNQPIVEAEADKLNLKVKKLVGRVRKRFAIGFVQGKFLLTKQETPMADGKHVVRGCQFFGRRDWRELLDMDKPVVLDNKTIDAICLELAPRSQAALSGDIRRFANITNLELISPKDDRFHRIYKGQHSSRRDRILLHLYDYSAAFTGNVPAEKLAKREFETLQRLQKSPWLARIMDSFQHAPEFPGELFYFSVVDPSAPSIRERTKDQNWSSRERVLTAALCAKALDELHNPSDEDCKLVVHRNLTGDTIRIRANGNPIFTGLNLAKLADAGGSIHSGTVSPHVKHDEADEPFIAPEVLKAGSGVADTRSDIYSLCASLKLLFTNDDELCGSANAILDRGLVEQSDKRITLKDLGAGLKALVTEQVPAPKVLPAAVYWDEETEVIFQNKKYKIVGKLGSGGYGTTFKVLHVDRETGEEYGTYVGKVIHKEEDAGSALRSYNKARPHSKKRHMSVIHEIADEWKENQFVALMEWVEGAPLSDLTGLLPLYAEDIGEESGEQLVQRWLFDLCDALSAFHEAELVHGDVSPRNIIVNGGEVTLTDYDLVTRAGLKAGGTGTVAYCAPNVQNRDAVALSDDVFALGASFFHVLFEQEPFQFKGQFQKNGGVNWDGLPREEYPIIAEFIDRATHADSRMRFSSAIEARKFLQEHGLTKAEVGGETLPERLTPNEVPWLLNLLSYPGSPYGNSETRGLDSEFAEQTYVETELEEKLVEQIRTREIQLIILSGNAGDGKTAFLQHIGHRLELPAEKSAKRIWDYKLEDGLHIRVNLDGSASYQGKSATELLDEFFAPFQQKKPPGFLVHLVAINSGPLQAWIGDYEERHGSTPLTEELWEALQGNLDDLDPRIRFIDLNNRSLVGGLDLVEKSISTDFIDRLIDKMLGGDEAATTWTPCQTCTAQNRCQAWNSARLLSDGDSDLRQQIRTRLYSALQAVHQRGEVHITARELRATLSYILFGMYYCKDLHVHPDVVPPAYFDLAFSPISVNRQGEVLRELTYLDPALDGHSQIDRYLVSTGGAESGKNAPRYPDLSLESARRRAYFEWSDAQVEEIAKDKDAMHLARGRHLSKFLRIGLMTDDERSEVCKQLCAGISKLVDLPPVALQQETVVPIRISPRTPTESAFWVNKPLARFAVQAQKFTGAKDLETLHTHVILSYEYSDGRREELTLNTELFNVLMELKDGYQMVDATSDDTFANLAIFTQRLAQEDQRTIYGWNPVHEKTVYELKPVMDAGKQKLVLKAFADGDTIEREPALEVAL